MRTVSYAEYPLCPIGPEYSNPDVLYALLQVIQSGRADTIKEALNILIDDSYRQKMQEYSQKIEKSVADIERNTKVSAIFCAGRFFR